MASDWQETLMERVATRLDKPKVKEHRAGAVYESVFDERLQRLHLHVSVPFLFMLSKACKERGWNRSTYMRRALAVQIAKDLGVSVLDVLHRSPSEGLHGHVQRNRGGRDSGVGIETFCPHPGCTGEHLTKS